MISVNDFRTGLTIEEAQARRFLRMPPRVQAESANHGKGWS